MAEIISLKRVNREREEDESVLPKDSAGKGGQSSRVQINRWENRVRGELENNSGSSTVKISAGYRFVAACLPVCLSVSACV